MYRFESDFVFYVINILGNRSALIFTYDIDTSKDGFFDPR